MTIKNRGELHGGTFRFLRRALLSPWPGVFYFGVYMFMLRLILLSFLMSGAARAYDTDESSGVYMQCLVEKRVAAVKMWNHHMPSLDGTELYSACGREAYDFMRFNCPNNPDACEGYALRAAYLVDQRIK